MSSSVSFADLSGAIKTRAASFSWTRKDHGERMEVTFDRCAPINLGISDPTVASFVRQHHEEGWTIEPMACLLLDVAVDLFGIERACDIGSHYGFLSLFLSRMDAIRHVDSIDMNPATLDVLRANMALNPDYAPQKMRVHNVGISDTEYLDKQIWYLGMRLFLEELPGRNVPSTTIDVLTLNGLMDRLGGAPDLLKIDVEGFEARMVDGFVALAEGPRPKILLELHGENLIERYGSSRKAIMRIFLDRGYKCALLNWHQKMPRGNHLTEVTLETLDAALKKPHAMYFFWD